MKSSSKSTRTEVAVLIASNFEICCVAWVCITGYLLISLVSVVVYCVVYFVFQRHEFQKIVSSC